ncbi:MAG: 3-dehydroquinate synthase [Erysipelotrichaceae bacterium]|nr:3-dehydroquinate synthase [Erysipelotrichaceae bacterium]
MKLVVDLKERSYPIILERGCTEHLGDYLDVNRKSFVISDEGVPEVWKQRILSQLNDAVFMVVEQGEDAKSFEVYQKCLKEMLKHNFHRKDQVIALGGGVVGDLSGFVAASYMRGIDFIQIPTTTLSQIDSSIGGKVAINVDHVKNCVGAFWQPKLVLIDPDTLSTLPKRHVVSGLIEALKAGCIQDEELFRIFEEEEIEENLEEILVRSLKIKKHVVEEDETEQGLRKILNYGHTIGHAIESCEMPKYYHGEAVGLGMLMICENEEIRQRILNCLIKLGAPVDYQLNANQLIKYLVKDKKASNVSTSIITVSKIGEAKIETRTFEQMHELLKRRESE